LIGGKGNVNILNAKKKMTAGCITELFKLLRGWEKRAARFGFVHCFVIVIVELNCNFLYCIGRFRLLPE
jgi:hypothetical protein